MCVKSPKATVGFCALSAQQHLLVSVQLLNKGAFMKQGLQPLLGVIVAKLLKGCPSLLLRQPGVLEARSVHDQQGAQRVLTRLQSPDEEKIIRKSGNFLWDKNIPLKTLFSAPFPPRSKYVINHFKQLVEWIKDTFSKNCFYVKLKIHFFLG